MVNSDLDYPTGTQFSDKANYFPRAVRKFNHLCVACKHGHSAIALFAHIYVTRGHELIGYLIHEPEKLQETTWYTPISQVISLFFKDRVSWTGHPWL